nr:zinc ribbon domain-containing protein YjdM [Flavobacterium sp. MK4S-17]
MEVKDSNGNILNDGDTVTVIKDLKVKSSSAVIKRGTTVKNIRLTDDPAEIDCRVNKVAMVLRTEFVKKS